MKVFIFIILILFLLSYALLINFYVVPVLKRILSKLIGKLNNKDAPYLENKLITESLKMVIDTKVHMPMENNSDLISKVRSIVFSKKNKQKDIFFFPKAFLLAGLSDLGVKNNDKNLMLQLEKIYTYYFTESGFPKFNFDKVDQVPFGITALNFYQFSEKKKYRDIADYIYNKLLSWTETNTQIIPYRKESNLLFIDTLGMVCPFLIRYSVTFKNHDALYLAYKQIHFYIEHGTDRSSALPFHVINKDHQIKLGPTNWGRGIGWYLLALSEFRKSFDDDLINNEIKKCFKSLLTLQLDEGLWSQFPGTSYHFDASVSSMLIYSMSLDERFREEAKNRFQVLKKHIKNGLIKSTSGDTINVNMYSNIFGDSEFSQGILLSIISNLTQ
jgi:rhamnogalacturonyl hydrolase YesR